MDYKKVLDELIEGQKQKVMELGSEIIPNLTDEDILQPNDYSELELNPYFRYEEGVLEGMMTVRSAMMARLQESSDRMKKQLGI